MTAPGWFPDPDGSSRLRYFDGTQWTANTADPPPGFPVGGAPTGNGSTPGFQQQGPPHTGQGFPGQQSNFHTHGQQPGFQPYPGGSGGPPPNAPGRSHLWGWVALVVVVALILGLGTWMLFFRSTTVATPTPTVTTAAPADPTTDQTSADPVPTDESPTVDPEPTPTAEPTSNVSVEPGSIIDPLTNCPATATDAIGEVGADGRLTSGAGFSMAAAEGFAPTPVQYPFVHQSNSQMKRYDDTEWAAAITVGTVHMDEGFTDPPTTVVAVAACILGGDFYEGADPEGVVVNFNASDENDVSAIRVDVTVQGQPGITSDRLFIMAAYKNDVMHVVISTVPDSDPEGTAAVGDVVKDVSLG